MVSPVAAKAMVQSQLDHTPNQFAAAWNVHQPSTAGPPMDVNCVTWTMPSAIAKKATQRIGKERRCCTHGPRIAALTIKSPARLLAAVAVNAV